VFDGLIILDVPRTVVRRLNRLRGAAQVTENPIRESSHTARSGTFRLGLEAWNLYFRGEGRRMGLFTRESAARPIPDRQDSWWPPIPADTSLAASGGNSSVLASVSSQPFGADPRNTSEFLAGTVSINLVLPESNGRLDLSTESWTEDREAKVVAGVTAGLEWIRAREPSAGLTFVYHVFRGREDERARTAYEPINRPADPMGWTGEDLWTKEILEKMGFASGDRWARSRAFADATRKADRTDWAVNVFVADSERDADGRFADGYFAYAWIGGPHVVLTYDNQLWGIDRMNQVVRHEILHAFYAFDEYSASGCGCAEHRGYLDGTNENCTVCNVAAVSCVMTSNAPDMCSSTRRQIGWADLDGDSADDVIGEDPDTFLDPVDSVFCGTVTGSATVVAATNRNPLALTPPNSISVNRIALVEARWDQGPWLPAQPEDGAWDDYLELFRVTRELSEGVHVFESRAADDHGNVDGTPARLVVDFPAPADDPGSTLRVSGGSGWAVVLDWRAAWSAAGYRVYRAVSPAGSWVRVAEPAGTSWMDASRGNAYYLVRSLNVCGRESIP
jgi:hypothetical protein